MQPGDPSPLGSEYRAYHSNEMMKENMCFGQFGDANANIIENLPQNPQNGARREKRFSCRFCEYTSANGSHVKRHELRHTGREPHYCRYCGKAIARKDDLKRHERTHERKFTCPMCTCGYDTQELLFDHLLVRHKVFQNSKR